MILYDSLSGIKQKPSSEELGLTPMLTATDWGLFERTPWTSPDGTEHPFNYSRFRNPLLEVLAHTPGVVALNDEEMRNRGLLKRPEFSAERVRAYKYMKQVNPDCRVGFCGYDESWNQGLWPLLTERDFLFYTVYYTAWPHTGFEVRPRETKATVAPYLWWNWADYGTVPENTKKAFIPEEIWRETCRWARDNYSAVVLWSAGSYRPSVGAPVVTQYWDADERNELYLSIAKEILLGTKPIRIISHKLVDGNAVVAMSDGNVHTISKQDFDQAGPVDANDPGLKIIHNIPFRWDKINKMLCVGRGQIVIGEPAKTVCPTCNGTGEI